MNHNKFLVVQVIIRCAEENNLENLEDLSAKLHSKPNVKVTWFVSPDVFTAKPEVIDRVLGYCEEFGDELTFDLECPCTSKSQETINSMIDDCMEHLRRLTGRYPRVASAWYLNAAAIKYLKERYNVEIVVGQMWEQLGVDGFSGVGSVNGPYYPSANHSMIPANLEENRLDVVLLDTISSDLYEAKFPRNARATVHPWDSNITAGDGVALQRHIARTYFDTNADRNDICILNMRFELDWMNQDCFTYNKNREMKARLFQFWEHLADTHQDVACVTLSEFNDYFRASHKDNGDILYRYFQQSKYDPNASVYWYFSKAHAVAVECRISRSAGPETIILDNSDFRKEGSWRDGYDTADYHHAVYPETRVRTASIDGAVDLARVDMKGGSYDVWILHDGTAAGSIEVMIDGQSLGIASGTCGVDGWTRLSSMDLSPGEHVVELINRYNPESGWYATYAEVLLTQEKNYRPARNRLLDKHCYVAVTNYITFSDDLMEPIPPANDWSVTNGINWKIEGVMQETLFRGDRYLPLHSQESIYKSARIQNGDYGRGELIFADAAMMSYDVEIVDMVESDESVEMAWRIYDGNKAYLTKRITVTRDSLIFEYDYEDKFDRLEIQDAFGKLHVLDCPGRLVFREGRLVGVESGQLMRQPDTQDDEREGRLASPAAEIV